MASTGEYYARLDGDRKVDIDVYHDKDGNVCVAIHDRDDGYTRVFNPDRIEVLHRQSSAIGGHCHWTELLFIEDEKRYIVRSAWSGNVFEEFIASIRHNVLGLRPTKLEWVWRAPQPMVKRVMIVDVNDYAPLYVRNAYDWPIVCKDETVEIDLSELDEEDVENYVFWSWRTVRV